MREFFRPAVATLSIACLASVLALASADIAFAQAKQQQPAAGQAAPPPAQPPEVKQMALTDKQIEAVLAAKKDLNAITDKLPDNVPADQKGLAQLDAVAKKNGFANYAEYAIVADNIGLVLAGFDPATKKYVGAEAVIKARIALVQADKKMSADDTKSLFEDAEIGGRRQEGRARRTQRGAEVAAARGHDQGQHRSRHQVLRQACRSLGRRSGVMAVA